MAIIKEGSKVLIIRGADAGKKGEVIEVKKEKGKGVMLKIKLENGKERRINLLHVEPL